MRRALVKTIVFSPRAQQRDEQLQRARVYGLALGLRPGSSRRVGARRAGLARSRRTARPDERARELAGVRGGGRRRRPARRRAAVRGRCAAAAAARGGSGSRRCRGRCAARRARPSAESREERAPRPVRAAGCPRWSMSGLVISTRGGRSRSRAPRARRRVAVVDRSAQRRAPERARRPRREPRALVLAERLQREEEERARARGPASAARSAGSVVDERLAARGAASRARRRARARAQRARAPDACRARAIPRRVSTGARCA